MTFVEFEGIFGKVLIHPDAVSAIVELDGGLTQIYLSSGHSEIICIAFAEVKDKLSP